MRACIFAPEYQALLEVEDIMDMPDAMKSFKEYMWKCLDERLFSIDWRASNG